jgi:hypothetical protein
MMKDEAARALARALSARNHNNGRALCIGAGDGVDQVERTGSKGDDGDTEPR